MSTPTRFDPNAADAYADHLSQVNQSRAVIASEDIYNSKGVLLVGKGHPISAAAVERIVQFKLVKPLDRSVSVSGTLTPQALLKVMEGELREADARRIHGLYDMTSELRRALAQLHRFPIICQKLTVMSVQLPYDYRRTMWGVWLSMLVARKLTLPERQRDAVVLAALARDIGLLHLPPDIVTNTGMLTPEQWRTKQSHVLIGQLMLREMEGMSEDVVRAVFEHHEAYDGSGSLTGASGDELGLLGRIVCGADAVATILFKLREKKRWARDLLPILQAMSYACHPRVSAAMVLILREMNPTDVALTTDEAIDELVQSIVTDKALLSAHAERLSALVERLPSCEHRAALAATRVNAQVAKILGASGILERGYVDWLSAVAKERNQACYREVEDTRLILNEVRWQLNKLRRLLIDATHESKSGCVDEYETVKRRLSELPFLADAA
jgi:hypothetical protein